MATIEECLAALEANNVTLKGKVAELKPCFCCCGQEDQPIVMDDGEREESSPSSYQTPPVASLDKNQVPLPVRIKTMREDQLMPMVKQEEIEKLFQAVDREREVSCWYIIPIVSGGCSESNIKSTFPSDVHSSQCQA